MYNISYMQYTEKEYADGTAIKYIKNLLINMLIIDDNIYKYY